MAKVKVRIEARALAAPCKVLPPMEEVYFKGGLICKKWVKYQST